MADEESQSGQKFPTNASAPSENEGQGKWVLTREAFDKLLHRFSPDRDDAGRLYEGMRVKLTRFFEWRVSSSPEADVDETFNRVARRIDEGEKISNLNAYFLSVARLVFMESLRQRDRTSVGLEDLPERAAESPLPNDQKEAQLVCLDKCLSELPSDDRDLILAYYQEEKRTKINLRKQLADKRGITLDALRIRACRIRKRLEKDTRKRLSQTA